MYYPAKAFRFVCRRLAERWCCRLKHSRASFAPEGHRFTNGSSLLVDRRISGCYRWRRWFRSARLFAKKTSKRQRFAVSAATGDHPVIAPNRRRRLGSSPHAGRSVTPAYLPIVITCSCASSCAHHQGSATAARLTAVTGDAGQPNNRTTRYSEAVSISRCRRLIVAATLIDAGFWLFGS